MKPSLEKVQAVLSQGWTSNHDLIEQCGMTDATRRVRELRVIGRVTGEFQIEMRRVEVRGRATNTFEYRIKPRVQQTVLSY